MDGDEERHNDSEREVQVAGWSGRTVELTQGLGIDMVRSGRMFVYWPNCKRHRLDQCFFLKLLLRMTHRDACFNQKW